MKKEISDENGITEFNIGEQKGKLEAKLHFFKYNHLFLFFLKYQLIFAFILVITSFYTFIKYKKKYQDSQWRFITFWGKDERRSLLKIVLSDTKSKGQTVASRMEEKFWYNESAFSS